MRMNKKDKKTLLPALRFPEFRDKGEWEKKELRDLVTMIKEKAGNNKFTPMSISCGLGLISQIEKFGREIAGAQYKNYFVMRKNDFAYNKSATKGYREGYIAMYSGTDPVAVPYSIFTCFTVCDENVSPQYLNYLFLGNLHGKWLRKYITVGARVHGSLNIDNEHLLSLPVPLPLGESSLKEQQKIADCLTFIEDLITAQTQKLEALKAHKTGLVQQLFPAEGETVPKMRFPEFRDAGQWKERKLSEILSEHKQKAIGTEEVFSVSVHKGLVNQVVHLGRSFSASSTKHYNRVLPGDIVYTKSPTGDFPLGIIKQSKLEFPAIVSPLYGVFSPETSALGTMLDAYFESPANAKFYLEPLVQKGAKNTINVNNNKFLSGSLILPLNKNEQQKIADCLTSVDELIIAQTQILTVLNTHKKGLMQQLFPGMDEVGA